MRLEDLPPVPGVHHKTVRTGDVELHVAEAGDGPPLLLLHGWPQHWWSYRKLIPRLAQRYRVIVPDLRGWGWSEVPAGDPMAKDEFARDILALMDAEGIERARVISHDWGAYAALLLALGHPERLERVVALDIAPPWARRPHPGLLLLPVFMIYQLLIVTVGSRLMTSSQNFIRTVIKVGSGPDAQWSDTELEAFAAQLQEPGRAHASVACYRTFLRRELLESRMRTPPASLDVPTLMIMGGAGLLHRIAAPEPRGNLRIETIPRAGHFLAEEKPDEVLALAEPFLAEEA